MGKFLLGLITGVVLVFLTIVLLFFAALRFRERPPTIAADSVLVLRLNGDIPERAPVEIPFLSQGPSLTVANVWGMLRKAAADPNIRAVVLEPEGLSAGWGKLEELRSDLEQFRKSGKPVYAFLRTPTAREYYIATPADRIYLSPADQMYLKGMRAEVMYLKNTLDKLGVTVDVEHAGKYKDFGDTFTRTNMSPETREVITSVVDDLYGNLVERIAAARKMTPDHVRELVDDGLFLAPEVKKAGLVDELRFEDQVWGELKSRLQVKDVKRVRAETYLRVPLESVGLRGKSRVALIVGEGDIIQGSPDNSTADESALTSAGFDRVLREVGNDSSIKGVIVRIDSPGGEVTASDDIWREMNLLSKKKPMVISMSDLAASGGYYMAMTGDPIVAYPGTETGSIGVVFGKPNLHGFYDKIGVTKDFVQRGKYAGIDSDYTSLNPDERAKLRTGVDASYQDFVTKVANARHRSFDQIEPVAQGRVWLGSQAKARGLVDVLGGLDTAIDLVKKRANIPASELVTVITYPPPRSLLDLVTRRTEEDMLDVRLRQVFGGMPFHAWMKGGFLRLMPYWITVR
ncbi:MAG TPA: signal peptide peptidase SppA [Bryobacteraceae bacterium]|nr:signal peptide peptidase SppA [Bryobacteraceae bacterium]